MPCPDSIMAARLAALGWATANAKNRLGGGPGSCREHADEEAA